MLATLFEKPFDRAGWYFEVKWDGYRVITEIKNGKVRLYSRKGKAFDKDFPEIAEAVSKINHDAVLDGEVVAYKNGKPDFHSLQERGTASASLQYMLFDILYLDGEDLRDLPLSERKLILRKLIPKDGRLGYSDHVEEDGSAFFDVIKGKGLEGMIAKKASSSYHEGVRSEDWLKVKHKLSQEAVIIGYTAPRGSRKGFGALVLGAYDHNGRLRYIGNSGGGFTDKELKEIKSDLDKLKTEKPPIDKDELEKSKNAWKTSWRTAERTAVTWVKPVKVCEVEYTEWTPDMRMRHPVYKGIREDKEARDVHIENPGAEDPPKFTHLDKIFWPKERYTKGDVIEYYEKMSSIILPYLIDRPESLNRFPNGIEGESFYQKNVSSLNLPSFIETIGIWSKSNKRETKFLLCQNKETLMYLANLGCIEINPWSSRKGSLDKPDYMIIDLDPSDDDFNKVIETAKVAHDLLEETCKNHFVKTSGKTGLHIVIPLGGKYDYDTVRVFSELLVRIIHRRIPQLTTLERTPAKRQNKVYLDHLQNRRGQTIASVYSLRPHPGATVSTPLQWKEVRKGLDPAKFNIRTIFQRLKKLGDIWERTLKKTADLEESIEKLQGMRLI